MIEIVPLAAHDALTALAAQWFETEWADYYRTQPTGQALADLRAPDELWLAAVENGALAGVISLRPYAIHTHPRYSPGLGGLLVRPALRGRGVGSALVEAASDTAREKRVTSLYTATETAASLVERLGWVKIDVVDHLGHPLPIYQLTL